MTDHCSSLDRIFGLLANRRRRYVLYSLNEAEDTVLELDDVAARLAEWERRWNGRDDGEDFDQLERIRITLHHNHLPRLADAGLIDYDARHGTVRNWEEPSLERWAKNDQHELPHLRAVFTATTD